MRNLLIIFAIILATGTLSAQWIQQTTNSDKNFTEISFVDETTGWAIQSADYPQIYYTTNGGNEWQWCFEIFGLIQGAGSSVFFSDPDYGWISDGNNIFHTGNGSAGCGSAWENQVSEPVGSVSSCLFFTDAQHGWYTGNYDGGCNIYLSKFYLTADGGNTWIFTDTYGYQISDIYFIDNQEGWALDLHNSGVQGPSGLWHTTDGGQSWTVISDDVNGSALCFTDPLNGWIAGYDTENISGFIMHTSDGGVTWAKQTEDGIPALNDIVFINTLTGWAIGNDGTIMHTTDGGSVWQFQLSGTTSDLNSISFADGNNGWICGDEGIILNTSNGGTVGIFEPDESHNPISIAPNPTHGISVISFNLQEASTFSLSVRDSGGKEIYKSIGESAGKSQTVLDCTEFPPGIYFVTLNTNEQTYTGKLMKR
jgi:photosystem II stability/assembly factor-like uncharacterized protein